MKLLGLLLMLAPILGSFIFAVKQVGIKETLMVFGVVFGIIGGGALSIVSIRVGLLLLTGH